MNKYKELKSFVATATERSMTKAAVKEKITPTMLGRRIDDLEARLGVRLLHRTTRHLTLTEHGRLFLKHCQDLLAELELGEAELFPDQSEASGRLSVLAPPYFCRTHVAPHVSGFLARFPAVRFSLHSTNDFSNTQMQDYDLTFRVKNVINPDFVSIKIASNHRVVCATPEYFRHYGRPKRLEDLRNHNCLAIKENLRSQRGWLFQDNGNLIEVRVDGNIDCTDGEVLAQWNQNHNWLAWRSGWEVSPLITTGILETVLDNYALPSIDITASYPRNRPPRLARLFITYLQEIYASPDYWSLPRQTAPQAT